MMTNIYIGLITAFLLLFGCSTAQQISGGIQSEQYLYSKITTQVETGYLLYLPEEYESSANWPLLLFLHGSGERGTDLEKVKIHGPPKLIANGKKFSFIVVSPQCPSYQSWNTDALDALLKDICKNYNVDDDRIYITGLSRGGTGTWDLAASFPNRFAAIAPICGRTDVETSPLLKDLPVWVFHGAKDKVVPLSDSQRMVDALERERGIVMFTIYPEAEHDSWTETYDNPKLYEWFLKHKRKIK